jgi:hypothetical protein
VRTRGPLARRFLETGFCALFVLGGLGGSARGDGEARAIVDRIAVRFFSPETGGVDRPRLITERVLAFEARLDAMTEEGGGKGQAEAHLRNALDRHVVEERLATLDVGGANATSENARLEREARADLEERAGGEGPIGIAAEEEGLDGDEINAIFTRRAHAAAYLDRAVTRFLHPQDEQLREVFRTSPHPFKNRPYEDVRGPLARWFVFERLKVLEAAFLQTARARVTVVVVPR